MRHDRTTSPLATGAGEPEAESAEGASAGAPSSPDPVGAVRFGLAAASEGGGEALAGASPGNAANGISALEDFERLSLEPSSRESIGRRKTLLCGIPVGTGEAHHIGKV